MSRIGHTSRRHPHCPSCDYDLVATIERTGGTGRGTCPECGASFEPQDLMRRPAPDDWTVVRGLQSLSMVLSLRTVLWAAAFLLVAWATPALTRLARTFTTALIASAIYLLGGLLLLCVGAALGVALGRKAEEHAGFSGPLLIAILIAWCVVATSAACMAAQALGLMAPTTAGVMGTIIASLSIVLVLREQLLEAY